MEVEVKEIEGVRIKPGEKLVIVAPSWWNKEMLQRIDRLLALKGIDTVILPDSAKLYIKAAE